MNNCNAEISFKKNQLTIKQDGSIKTVEFQYDISGTQKFDDCLVVMIDPPKHVLLNENIFGLSYEGKMLWQIEKIEHVDVDSPYTGLGLEDSQLTVYNWDGCDYLVDPKTGKIKGRKFVR
jgi:hypothetical protein